ncbi:MAG: cadmium-translocating P-type ATPase [Thermoproteales archaeon]|nr:cadmium-translocating P-type ATPase [Thermoproteales archaeon]
MKFKWFLWALIIFISLIAVAIHKLNILGEPYLLLISILIFALYIVRSFMVEKKPFVDYAVMLLMLSVGILTYIFGLHVEGSLVLAFFALAEILEDYAEKKAESSLKALMDYMPKMVRLVVNGSIVEVDVKKVRSGDVVLVGRGDRVPVDGVIVEGVGSVDQSVITGEPLPVVVGQHSFVYAGSLVVEGAFKVRATTSGDASLFSRLVELVNKYKESRTRMEKFIHRFSKIYLPLMLFSAVLAWLVFDISVALVIIAIACPSAFLVSISATFLYSLSMLAHKGILSKGTAPIERAAKIRIIAFDKTGTLTLGKPQVDKIFVLDESLSRRELLKLAASVEVASSHPLARAIVEEAKKEEIKLFSFEKIEELPGMGIIGKVNGYEIAVGSIDLMTKIGLRDQAKEDIHSPYVYVANNGEVIGLITFSDRLDPKTRFIIKKLKEMNFKVVMLTGDKRENAEKISRMLDISEFYAELSPEEKVSLIDELKKKYGKHVAMIGDGINDAPALAAADLGIAVGSIQAVMEAGDIALTSGSLENILHLFETSRRTVRKVVENIAMIMIAKILVVFLSVLGLIPLWSAVAVGDDGAMLFTLANTFLTLKKA